MCVRICLSKPVRTHVHVRCMCVITDGLPWCLRWYRICLGSIPGSRRLPGEGNGYPLQYSCLENPMDRLQSMGLQRVGHDWANHCLQFSFSWFSICTHWFWAYLACSLLLQIYSSKCSKFPHFGHWEPLQDGWTLIASLLVQVWLFLCRSCPRPGIGQFSKDFCFLLVGNGIKDQNTWVLSDTDFFFPIIQAVCFFFIPDCRCLIIFNLVFCYCLFLLFFSKNVLSNLLLFKLSVETLRLFHS